MKTRTFFAALALTGCLAFMGCEQSKKNDSNNANGTENIEKNTHVAGDDSVNVTSGDDRVRATKDGEPFTGEIWSDDGKTYVLKFKDGESNEGILYHKNGKPAMVAGEVEKFYDEEGKELTAEKFTEEYAEYLEEVSPQIEGVFQKMNNMK